MARHRLEDLQWSNKSEVERLELDLLRESIQHRVNQRATLIAHGFGNQVRHRRAKENEE